MGFKKGEPRPNKAGRKAGTPNTITRTVKELVLSVFNEIQEHPTANLKSFAESEPIEFYKIASKLIPSEISAHIDHKIITVTIPGKK